MIRAGYYLAFAVMAVVAGGASYIDGNYQQGLSLLVVGLLCGQISWLHYAAARRADS